MRRFLFAAFTAAALACASAPRAEATPFTNVLDPLISSLSMRRDALNAAGDPASLAQAKAMTAALAKAEKTKSKSLLGDVAILKSMAAVIEKKIVANDMDLLAALGAVTDRVQTVVDEVNALADSAFEPAAAAAIRAIAAEAQSIVDATRNPTPEMNTVTARAGFLRSAMKKLLSALGIAADDERCTGRGTVKTDYGTGTFNPRFVAATAYTAGGAPYHVSIVSYTYDRTNPDDPYHAGQIGIDLYGSSATIGTHTVTGNEGSPLLNFRKEGVGPDDDVGGYAESGTVTVTRLDVEDEEIEGRFSVVVRFQDNSALSVNGRFRICQWQLVAN